MLNNICLMFSVWVWLMRIGVVVILVLRMVIFCFGVRLFIRLVFLCVMFLIDLKDVRWVGVIVVISVILGWVRCDSGVILLGLFMLILMMVKVVLVGIWVSVSGMF